MAHVAPDAACRTRCDRGVAWRWLPAGAQADEPLIGVAAPLTGPSARCSASRSGPAPSAAAASGSRRATLEIVDDALHGRRRRQGRARNSSRPRSSIVVGFLCTEAIEAALPILKDAGIPVITVGVRTDSLTDRKVKTGWPVYPAGAARRRGRRGGRLASCVELWRDELFAIVDDGTIYGRELAETLRAGSRAGRR